MSCNELRNIQVGNSLPPKPMKKRREIMLVPSIPLIVSSKAMIEAASWALSYL